MISEWAKGYEAAIRDARTIFASRRIDTAATDLAFADLASDAAVIDHALLNDRQRRELRVTREVQLELLP
jgi:hypothetical protein